VVSKSISAIHYSNVINTGNPLQRIKMTEKAALNSFVISVLALIVLFFIPETLFTFVFGEDFVGVKALTIYLFPGIIAVAVSNIYGHYFSGIGKMRILIIKSSIGLVATAIFLFLLLRKYGLTGACITLDIAYIASSTYLYIMFLKEKREISLAD
jgi:O-antigen/teichoic acid export membrane protein